MAYIIAALITVVIDQLTKIAIMANFKIYESRPILGQIASLTYVTNKGGAFGLLSSYPTFFVVLAILLSLAGIVFLPRIFKMRMLVQVALGLLLGGTLGNLIDRLRFGSVVDFLDFHFWPTFNVADIAICTGVGIIIIIIITTKEGKNNTPTDQSEESEATLSKALPEKLECENQSL